MMTTQQQARELASSLDDAALRGVSRAGSALRSLATQVEALTKYRNTLKINELVNKAEYGRTTSSAHEAVCAERDAALKLAADRFNFLCDCENEQALDILCEQLGQRDGLIKLVDALISEARAAS